MLDQHIQEFIRGNDFIVCACVADRSAECQPVRLQAVHCLHNLLEIAGPSSRVIDILEAFNRNIHSEVSKAEHVLAEFVIDQRAVCKCREEAVIMLLAEFPDIVHAHGRLTAGHQERVNTELLGLRDDPVHILI